MNRLIYVARRAISWILVVGTFALGIAYIFPDEFVRNPDPNKRVARNSTVLFIENLTRIPIWGIAFLTVSMLIAACLAYRGLRPMLAYAHLAAGVLMVMYSIASFTTAGLNPGTYVTGAIMSTMVTLITLVLMWTYNRTKPRRVPDDGDGNDYVVTETH